MIVVSEWSMFASCFFLVLFILCFGIFFVACICTSRATPHTAGKPDLTRRASIVAIQDTIDAYYEGSDPVTIVPCEVLIYLQLGITVTVKNFYLVQRLNAMIVNLVHHIKVTIGQAGVV